MPDVPESIAKGLENLRRYERELLNLEMAVLRAYGGTLYPLDLMAAAGAKRALAQATGFRHMIETRNLVCAGALLRLQVDTALRFYAAFRVESPHDFAMQVFDGAEIRNLKDRHGHKMTDKYLVSCLVDESPDNAWIERVYKETSGYVHFSSKHMFSIYHPRSEEHSSVHIEIGATDVPLPDSIYAEALEAFIAATSLFMRYLHGWGTTKQNPHLGKVARNEVRRKPRTS